VKYFVGVDIGGTRLKAGLVDETHRVCRQRVVWLKEEDKTEERLLDRLGEIIREVASGHDPIIVGVGVPGIVVRTQGMVLRSPNFPAVANFRIQERLEQRISWHVAIDNDAHCVLTGEYLRGAAREHKTFLGFTLGTGIGGAVFQDGHLWRGIDGMAGEFGHVIVDAGGRPCGCGNRGCLEMYVSRMGFRAALQERPIAGMDPNAADMPEALRIAAEAGDSTALQHLETAGTMLGRAIGNLVNALNFRAVVIAGGLAPLLPWMEDSCRAALAECTYPELSDGLALLGTSGEEAAGILGAAMQWKMAPHD
jgi:glucokinase